MEIQSQLPIRCHHPLRLLVHYYWEILKLHIYDSMYFLSLPGTFYYVDV